MSNDEIERYNRQIIIEGWGINGQKLLKDSKVVIVGVGGLGCPTSLYLTAAGVGHIVLIDSGKFELSNLNRQILGWMKDLGQLKVESAAKKLEALNPNVYVETINERVYEKNVSEFIFKADAVVDALDNWNTRFIINRDCVEKGIPLIHAGVSDFHGQAMTIIPGKGPCLRCLLPKNPSDKSHFPVLGTTPGLFSMIQTTETIKVLLNLGKPLIGRMLVYDGLDSSFMQVEVKRSPTCTVCKHI